MTLTKHLIIVLMLQIITYATSFNIHKEVNIKIRRSPANHLPLFGIRPSFHVPNIFSGVQQPLNTLKQLIAPVEYHYEMQANFHQPIETSGIIDRNESGPYNMPMNSWETQGIGTISSDVLDTPNKEIHKIQPHNNRAENKSGNLDHTLKSTDTVNTNERNDKQEMTNYDPSSETAVIDKESLNSVINEILQNNNLDSKTTTEDTTLDYTTGTGDYETTTIDELGLRIPAAAVATLLGR